MAFGDAVALTLFTADPELAERADAAGVDRVGVDLERIGKHERQAGLNCRISDHRLEDLACLRPCLRRARLFARTNPLHPGSHEEIEACLAVGAQVLMLPMFRSADDAARFVALVGGRAEVSLLVETPQAAAQIGAIVRVPGVDEVHVGLNDLALGLGLASHFEVLVGELVEAIARAVHGAGLPLGVGGVARMHDGALPIPADLVYAQFPRLDATRALVARVFLGPDPLALDLAAEVSRTRARISWWSEQGPEALAAAHAQLRALVARGAGRRAGAAAAAAAPSGPHASVP